MLMRSQKVEAAVHVCLDIFTPNNLQIQCVKLNLLQTGCMCRELSRESVNVQMLGANKAKWE